MIHIHAKKEFIYYIVMLLVAASFLCNIHRDNITKEYYNYPDYPELNNISVNEEYQNAYAAGEQYAGQVTTGPVMTLPKGQYELTFNYSSDSPAENNYFQIADLQMTKEDNTTGQIAAAGYFEPHGEGVFPFTLEEDIEKAQLITYTQTGDLKVNGYTLRSTAPLSNDSIAMALLTILGFALFRIFCIKRDNNMQSGFIEVREPAKLGVVLAVLLVGLISSMPCFTDFITGGHDLDYHLTRIEGLKEALLCGQLPVRVNPEFANGYGHANSIMYPELFLYFPALLRCMNVSLILSYKIFCVVMNLLCAWVAYFSFKRITKSPSMGVLMSAFYTLSLYRMNNLYMRAAMGEWLGMIFLPLVMYGMYALFYGEKKQWGWSVLAFTLCLQGHLLATEMAVGFGVLFAALSWKKLKEKGRILTIAKAGIFTVLVNLWYVIPLLYFYRMPLGVAAEQVALEKNGLYLPQIFSTFLYNNNLGEVLGSMKGEMPQTIGGIFLIGMILYLYTAYFKKNLTEREKKIGNMLLGFGLLSLWMASVYFPWDMIQKVGLFNVLAGILQFPMRLLSMATLFLSGVTAIGLHGTLRENCSGKTIALIGTLAAIAASAYTLDAYTEQNGTKLQDVTDDYNKNELYGGLFYYADTDLNAMMNREAVVVSSSGMSITDYHKKGTTVSFSAAWETDEEGWLEVPLYYYPGYQAVCEGSRLEVTRGENGILRVNVPGNVSGEFVIQYKEMPLFLIADIITVLAAAGAAVLLWKEKKKGAS